MEANVKASPWDNGSKEPLSKDSTQRPRPDSNRGPFDPKSDAVTDWPLCLHYLPLHLVFFLLHFVFFFFISFSSPALGECQQNPHKWRNDSPFFIYMDRISSVKLFALADITACTAFSLPEC